MDNNMNNNANTQPAYEAPQAPVYEATPQAPAEDNSMKTMIFGILGLALSELGILGLIFSILGMKQANLYQQNFGQLTGKAKVGAILSKIGLILSIVMMVVYVISFIVGIIAGLFAANYADSYYYY